MDDPERYAVGSKIKERKYGSQKWPPDTWHGDKTVLIGFEVVKLINDDEQPVYEPPRII